MNFVPVAHAVNIAVNGNIPGGGPTSTLPGTIQNFYTFALIISGILAFAVIVYGGVRYAWSSGNPSGESEAKSWITSALLGLLLLAGAYVILQTINPNLVALTSPVMPELGQPATSTAGTFTPSATCPTCPSGQVCIAISGGYSCYPQQYLCGGQPPNSNFGPCPVLSGVTRTCVNAGGNTPATAYFGCQ